MSERLEEDLMEDLAFDEAEGAAEMGEEETFEEFEDAAEEDLGAEEEWEGAEEEAGDGFEEAGEGFDEFGDEGAGYGDEEEDLTDAMAYALGAEDTDEFFRRIARGIRRVAPVVGRIARRAAPIARLIPHPWAQVAATGLGVLGRLRAEGASEEDALDAFAELGAYDESVLPIVAGMAARAVVRNRGARMPLPIRRMIVRGMATAARTLAQRRPAAVRALPRIVRSVRRTAAARRTPVRAIPRIVRRTAATVARSPRLIRRLSRPTPAAARVRPFVRRAVAAPRGTGRTFVLRGPVRISISGAG